MMIFREYTLTPEQQIAARELNTGEISHVYTDGEGIYLETVNDKGPFQWNFNGQWVRMPA